ncbi:hypothetical protein [Paenibacillus sp. BR1-192]|uniref:hypothetical protein n=1 Tax=Paenibacillus sp. BR1-192 TaxID=3032287 RepID=UPI00240E0A3B|nr:hypothetical protein [Paenibacillus sp. BR1-192]WFB60561.1 hypothetical protein P0X86_10305 [Paenibacillus sp. BR1-192]
MNTAEWDQMMMAFCDVAKMMAKYRDELLAQGFSRDEALRLVVEYQKQALGPKK